MSLLVAMHELKKRKTFYELALGNESGAELTRLAQVISSLERIRHHLKVGGIAVQLVVISAIPTLSWQVEWRSQSPSVT